MDDTLKEIKADVKEIKRDIKELTRILDKNTGSLIVHEARTTLAEHRIQRFEDGVKWMLGLILSAAFGIFVKLVLK